MIGGLFTFVAVAISAACGSLRGELHFSQSSGNAVDLVNSFKNGRIVSGDLLGSEFPGIASTGLSQLSSLGDRSSDVTIPSNNESVLVLESPVAAPVLESVNSVIDNGSEVTPTEFLSSLSVGLPASVPISTLSSVASFAGQESGSFGISNMGTPAYTPIFSPSPVLSPEISFPGIFPSQVPSSEISPPAISFPGVVSSELSLSQSIPSGLSPQLSSPGISLPGVSDPQISLLEMSPPEVFSSDISSKIYHSGIPSPEISFSGVSSSGINPSGIISGLPAEIRLPEISTEISSSEMYLPGVSFPEFSPSKISPPGIIPPSGLYLPGVSVPEIPPFEISSPAVYSPGICPGGICPPGVSTSTTSEINPSGVFSSDISSSAISPTGVSSHEISLSQIFPPGVSKASFTEIHHPVVAFSRISSEISPRISSSVDFSSGISPAEVSSPGFCPPGIYPCGITNAGTSSNLIPSSGMFQSVSSSVFTPFYSSPSISAGVSSGTISSELLKFPTVSAVASSKSSPSATSLPDVTSSVADSSCGSSRCENSVCDSSEDVSSPVSSTVVSAPVVEPTSIATPVTSGEPLSYDPSGSEASPGCENNVCGC